MDIQRSLYIHIWVNRATVVCAAVGGSGDRCGQYGSLEAVGWHWLCCWKVRGL